MSNALAGLHIDAAFDRRLARPLGIFTPWRLQVYGYTLAAVYAGLLTALYGSGRWFVDPTGAPDLNDFTAFWIDGRQALHGAAATLYDPAEFMRVQVDLVGPNHPKGNYYPNWPYPPIFFLILAPFAMLPYVTAFLTWELLTLVACIIVVYLIVRRQSAIALVLGSPLTAWNFFEGQTGFLRASLLGAALLSLERQPALAGVAIGCLTYKPQFGILLPVALIAAKNWRAIASATVTTALLVAVSIAAFGTGPWAAFPHEVVAQAGDYLVGEHPNALHVDAQKSNLLSAGWNLYQTVYGLARALNCGATLAWIAQGIVTFGVATIVWLVWRSPVRYALKAATLSAATLIATPYGWAYDMAAIVIPVAFLAADQLRHGLLSGEQTILLTLFAACLVMLLQGGGTILGPIVVITLFCLVVRRYASWREGA